MEIQKLIMDLCEDENNGLIDSIVKPVSLPPVKKDTVYVNVLLDFNLDKKAIEIKTSPFTETSPSDYNYFGNNQSANIQTYVVRMADAFLYYWNGKLYGIMKNLLMALPECELMYMLTACESCDMFCTNGINLNKVETEAKIKIQDNNFYFNDKKMTPEKFLMNLAGDDISTPVLVVPRIIKDNECTVISLHKDYTNYIRSLLVPTGSMSKGICHLCGRESEEIDTVNFSSKLPRNSVTKIFTVTNTSTAPNFNRSEYNKSFAICRTCYEKILAGQNIAQRDFTTQISGVKCLLLFDEIFGDVDRKQAKRNVELVFRPHYSEVWRNAFDEMLNEQESGLYEICMIFYKTDGKSTEAIKTIEITNVRLKEVVMAFEGARIKTGSMKYFTIGSLYNLIPMRSNNKGEIVGIRTLLDLYDAILNSNVIERDYIFDLFSEACSRTLQAQKGYNNMIAVIPPDNCQAFQDDYIIQQIVIKYIILFHALQRLKILNRDVFMESEHECVNINNEYIRQAEEYLNAQGFQEEARGLFYLGMLLFDAGNIQLKKMLGTANPIKLIVRKINYGGMLDDEVKSLYEDIMTIINNNEKDAESWIFESYIHDSIRENLKKLPNGTANIFYILSGYTYSLGKIVKNEEKNLEVNNAL